MKSYAIHLSRVQTRAPASAQSDRQISRVTTPADIGFRRRCARPGRIFDVGGAAATRGAAALDRHRRNLRTLFSHNPAAYKARALGNLRVNGEPLPLAGHFRRARPGRFGFRVIEIGDAAPAAL